MKTQNIKKINYGISILRVILSFMVILDHFYKRKKHYYYILLYHIPTFFVISFYYTYNTFSRKNIPKIKLRFERLVIPYLGWSLISWILFNIYFYLFKDKCIHSFYSLLLNLLSGRIFISVLWFQNILILITLIISIIILLSKKYLLIFQILICISYFLQYSGLNYHFFKSHYTNIFYNTYGRFIEVFPDALSGYFFAHSDIYDKLINNRTNVIIINLFVLAFTTNYLSDKKILLFRYGGLRKNVSAICIFLIFLFLPLEKIKNHKMKKILDIITSNTAGIYFVHLLIGRSKIMKLLLGIKINDIFGCITIYMISFIISFIFGKIFKNTKLIHMFK